MYVRALCRTFSLRLPHQFSRLLSLLCCLRYCFLLTKDCMHNEVWGCTETLPKPTLLQPQKRPISIPQKVKFPHGPILHYAFNSSVEKNNDKNNTLRLGKQICFTIEWGCAEVLPRKMPWPKKGKRQAKTALSYRTALNGRRMAYCRYIYKTNCRQYCFGLLGLISAMLMLGWR